MSWLSFPSVLESKLRSCFNYFNLLLRQAIEIIHQCINLPVGGVDLALEGGLVLLGPGGGQLRSMQSALKLVNEFQDNFGSGHR